jgi:hypothetical protein
MQVWVTVPEIAVSMDAQEFHILQDVAASLATEQVGSQPASPQFCSANRAKKRVLSGMCADSTSQRHFWRHASGGLSDP